MKCYATINRSNKNKILNSVVNHYRTTSKRLGTVIAISPVNDTATVRWPDGKCIQEPIHHLLVLETSDSD